MRTYKIRVLTDGLCHDGDKFESSMEAALARFTREILETKDYLVGYFLRTREDVTGQTLQLLDCDGDEIVAENYIPAFAVYDAAGVYSGATR